MKIHDRLKVLISDIDFFGRGVVRINDFVVFVDNTLTGDEVLIEITEVKKHYALAKMLKILKRSSLRTCKVCKYSDLCNCTLIDMDYAKQIEFKRQKLVSTLKKIANLDVAVNEVITSKNTYYRNKAKFHFKKDVVGFYKENTNDLIDINECVIVDKKINEVYEIIKNYNLDCEITFKANERQELLVSIIGNIEPEVLEALKGIKEIRSIYHNSELVYGSKYIIYTLDNYQFSISNKSFFQTNMDVFTKTLSKIKSYLTGEKQSNLLDLYCGVGIIGIYISNCVKSVVGIEVEEDAITDANLNKKINKITNIDFLCGQVENKIDELTNVDIIIVDPPRKGLSLKMVDSIIKLHPQKIIYVSCNPSTLSRDMSLLKDDYMINDLTLVDMFPNTYHVESVCVMKLR